MKIERITQENAPKGFEELVIVTYEDGNQTVYQAHIWDELEAQREQSGTL